MNIYHYSPTTGEYLRMGYAKPDPLEPGRYLIPKYATTTAPPATGENEVAVFEGGEWVLKPDYRGQTFYVKATKEAVTITEIGVEPEESMTDVPPDENQKWDEDSEAWALDEDYVREQIRLQRNALLAEADWLILRHIEQSELVAKQLLESTTLSPEQYEELLLYKQALRDMMETVDINDPVFPDVPDFLENTI